MKKMILLVALTLIFTSVIVPSIVNAATSGDYTYTDNGDGTCTITAYSGPSGYANIPSVLDTLIVTRIGDYAFNRKGLRGITIPSTVGIIGSHAFDGNLIVFVTLPSSVYYIGLDAFDFSYQLPSGTGTWYAKDASNNYVGTPSGGNSVLPNRKHSRLVYPYTGNGVGTCAIIDYFATDADITIPGTINSLTVTGIENRAFYYQDLDSVILPVSVENIGVNAFDRNNFTVFLLPPNNAQWDASNSAQYLSGDSVSVSLGYTVYNYIPNRKSAVPAADTASVHTNTAYLLNLSAIFEDKDGNTMTYEVDIDTVGYISANENYSYTPTSDGAYTLVFRASDATSTSSDTYTVTLTAASQYFNITYDANGGTGSDSETRAGASTDTLHDGVGFAMDNNIIDGWTIGSDTYMLADIYKMPLNSVIAYAIWAPDTDGDGISDDDETIAGTSPTDPNDVPQKGSIQVTVLNDDGTPNSGVTCVLNSTPIFVVADANGKAAFNGVSLSSHVLSIRSGSTVLGKYTLDFTIGADDSSSILNNGSGGSNGQIATTVTGEFMMLDVIIEQNGSGFWEISGSDVLTTRDFATNPQTGDIGSNVWCMIIAAVFLMLCAGVAVKYKAKQN